MKRIILFLFLMLFIFLSSVASATITTSGDTTTDGNYTIVTFLTNGTFNTTVELTEVSILLVGGGGAGGIGGGAGGGGGAAGGLIYEPANHTISANDYNIIVGYGGLGNSTCTPEIKADGGNSSFDSLIAIGGGRGGYTLGCGDPLSGKGAVGGSGGGGAAWNLGAYGAIGGAGTAGQGYAGGSGAGGDNHYTAGGGGGASEVGADMTTLVPGNGGDGLNFTISGSNIYYAGGGGAACGSICTNQASGGVGGGGKGQTRARYELENGTDGLGGGGGGLSSGGKAGNGGSGVVILRFIEPPPITITNSTYNMTSDGGNISWRTDKTAYVQTTDGTPNLIFNTNLAANCSFRSVVGNYNVSHICSSTGGTSHSCNLYYADRLSFGASSVYASCESGAETDTTGALNINMTAGTGGGLISCIKVVGAPCAADITSNCASII